VLEAFYQGLLAIFHWPTFGYMLIGIFVGFWVGLLPGLGGGTTLALMLPFIYGMDPISGFAFLLGMHAVVATTGDITSILFGVPGEGVSAATVLDGYAMTKRGEAGRALGAALFSSLVGALVGALALAISIPVVRPVVLLFGSPELFMLAVLGITFIASLSGRAIVKGLLAGAVGLLFSMVGMDPQTGILRYTLGQLYLWEGINLTPAVIGIFAFPEIINLAIRGTAISEVPADNLSKGVMQGVKDTFTHWWLTVRCSLLGAWIGVLPGMGGGVAQWMAYGHAIQSSKDPSRFGKGAVEGVLAPGAANNSKEGGALIPTIAFGVPGSSSMAILLGGFLILGVVPGPDMLTKHLTVTTSMVWTLIVSNIITVAASLFFLNQLAKITYVRGALLIPFIVLLAFLGSYTTNNSIGDLFVTLFFGILGYFMVLYGWPRAPLVLGLVLGEIAENYLFISVSRYGASFLLRPIVILLLLLSILAAAYPTIQERRKKIKIVGENR